mmetsp:Transcript_13643/g.29296  ORF Transcript_13643/g.29296 Transcript_13643/m.29296 type:complete len:1355 (+) Transcript_13643:39-4103(+)
MYLRVPNNRRRLRQQNLDEPMELTTLDGTSLEHASEQLATNSGVSINATKSTSGCNIPRQRKKTSLSSIDTGMLISYAIVVISIIQSISFVPSACGFGFGYAPSSRRFAYLPSQNIPIERTSTIGLKRSRIRLYANSGDDNDKRSSSRDGNNSGKKSSKSRRKKSSSSSGRPPKNFTRKQYKVKKSTNQDGGNGNGSRGGKRFSSRSSPSSAATSFNDGKGSSIVRENDDDSNKRNESRSNKNNTPTMPSVRDQMSSSHHPRAKMKKLSSSSYSTLLPPPSILSRMGNNVSGTRWTSGTIDGQTGSGSGNRGKTNDIVSKKRGGQAQASSSSTQENEGERSSYKFASNKGIKSQDHASSSKSGAKNELPSSISTGGSAWDIVLDHNSPSPPSSSSSTTSGKETLSTDLPQWGSLFENQTGAPYPSSAASSDLFSPSAFPSPALDGVLPVSELFYRSTQSISNSVNSDYEVETSELRQQNKKKKSIQDQSVDEDEEGDDEELPFSAEQSDRLSIPGNKIQIRRNQATMDKDNSSPLFLDEIANGMGMSIGGDSFPSEAVQRELTNMAEQEQEEQRRLELRTQQQQQQQGVDNSSTGGRNKEGVALSRDDDINTKKKEVVDASDGRKAVKPRSRKGKGDSRGDRAAGRKMVRRGMEMLVAGEPINADPPQRSIELNYYRKHGNLWSRAITTNSPDFGPLLHMHSAAKVSKESIGLYCENFVSMTQKWKICPDDLRFVVSEHEVRRRNLEAAAEHAAAKGTKEQRISPSVSNDDMEALIQSLSFESGGNSAENADHDNISVNGFEVDIDEGVISDGSGRTIMFNPRELNAPKGFGAQKSIKKKVRESLGGGSGMDSEKSLIPVHTLKDGESSKNRLVSRDEIESEGKLMFTLGGELKFSLGVTRSDLESGHGGAFRRVLREGIGASINAKEMGFDVHIAKLVIVDAEGGSTDVVVQFQLDPQEAMDIGEAERAAKEVNGALASAMDDGKMALALAHAAREEKGWTSKVRDRIVEEFLFETEDDDEDKEYSGSDEEDDDDPVDDDDSFSSEDFGSASKNESESKKGIEDDEYDGPFGMDGDVIHAKDDIWLGGGNGGVFFDYSESNRINSPYKGELGPYLLDAVTERARQNQPRVIAIGDVHGCIDELQLLLRKCDYHPGDVIIFLGDLVCKGPDSLSVVQMAREIGAIGVRGNHDFEVVRWHQAIKSGADPPVIGSEHYYVASALGTADLKWMYSLPWYISSTHLSALFVHAGFVSGIRLAKQNPRLMMNMRSILPDGTVTSKFFNNWPWARLWDGPHTVFFGHDADRGLQKYEHAIGLDTGCVYGGKLTACILPERRLVSVNAKREYFQYRRKHFD